MALLHIGARVRLVVRARALPARSSVAADGARVCNRSFMIAPHPPEQVRAEKRMGGRDCVNKKYRPREKNQNSMSVFFCDTEFHVTTSSEKRLEPTRAGPLRDAPVRPSAPLALLARWALHALSQP